MKVLTGREIRILSIVQRAAAAGGVVALAFALLTGNGLLAIAAAAAVAGTVINEVMLRRQR